MNHLQYAAKSHHLQWNIKKLSKLCYQLYHDYCSESFKHRRNVNLSKVSDQSLLVLLLLQVELGRTSQRHFYRICQLFPCGHLLERSRFNRRARQVIWLVQIIRQAMNDRISPDTIVIIDSFPLPLCQPVRNHRARIFDGLADIGYNASKRLWFYGFKVHMLVTLSSYILNYVVTPASVHNIRAVNGLLENCHHLSELCALFNIEQTLARGTKCLKSSVLKSLMGISPAVLLRWQPERSEVSLSLFVIMADREPLYFIANNFRSYHGVSH